MAAERFFLTQDSDCHWYVVPVANRSEWDEWCNISSDDERAWTPPSFAKPINGNPSRITFEAPA